jgi:hypothetical protein
MTIEEYLKQVIDVREYKRAQAVKLSEEGLSRAAIASALSVSPAAQNAFTRTRDALVHLEKKTPKKGPQMPLQEAKGFPSLTAAVVL